VDETVCAIFLEPIQGEGGVCVPPADYFPKVAELAAQKNVLLILDEIQTGLGRTGRDFAFRHFGIKPDIMTLGKALGSGYPIGATLSAEEPSLALSPGTHSTTVGGAPLAMALALDLCQRILDPTFLMGVAEKGQYFQNRLNALKSQRPNDLKEIRGLGLIIGVELSRPAAPVVSALRDLGFLVNAASSSVLRFVPPLTVTEEEIDLLAKALSQALEKTAS
jgi:acetylornithine/succinyldiaminopimelate/putrescine aminotransferase